MSGRVTQSRLNFRKPNLSALPRMEQRESGAVGRETRLKAVRLSWGEIIGRSVLERDRWTEHQNAVIPVGT